MLPFSIPNSILEILLRLENAGYQSCLVGGCVRDGLMGLVPHDWDIATSARPEAVQALFPDSLTFGIRHGTVTVRWNGVSAEVTTFRAEGSYSDHRRPDEVRFIEDLREDLARRDFTVNAIAIDASGCIHDPFDGQEDMRAGILRAVGNAEKRFEEDALRMLRAVRFSAQLGFVIEEQTQRAVLQCAPLVSSLAAERVCAEVERTLLTDRPQTVLRMAEYGLLAPWGITNLPDGAAWLSHLEAERTLRWAGFSLLLNDTVPLCNLKLDKKTIHACEISQELRAQRPVDEISWKAAISRYGSESALLAAKALSAMDGGEERKTVQSILSRGDCCAISQLAVSGDDLSALGLTGREIGDALHRTLRHVWEHPEENNAERLIRWIREELNNHG